MRVNCLSHMCVWSIVVYNYKSDRHMSIIQVGCSRCRSIYDVSMYPCITFVPWSNKLVVHTSHGTRPVWSVQCGGGCMVPGERGEYLPLFGNSCALQVSSG